MRRKQKILITGSAGYIGSSLKKCYGARFSFIDFDIRENRKNDVRDLSRLKRAVRGVDGVIHLAAVSRPKWGYKDPYTCLSTNIMGTVNVLEAVRKVNPRAWVILGSSREVFGDLKKLPGDEKSPRRPLNAYGVSKVAGEDLLRQYALNYGLRCLTLRFCGVYTGKRDIPGRVVPHFIKEALRGRTLFIEGSGKKRSFDFIYINDALDGIARAMRYLSSKKRGFYDNITLAANSPTSIYDLAWLVIKLMGSKSVIKFIKNRSYDQLGYWGKYDKAKKLLGWKPKIRIKDGLKMAIRELKPLAMWERYKK